MIFWFISVNHDLTPGAALWGHMSPQRLLPSWAWSNKSAADDTSSHLLLVSRVRIWYSVQLLGIWRKHPISWDKALMQNVTALYRLLFSSRRYFSHWHYVATIDDLREEAISCQPSDVFWLGNLGLGAIHWKILWRHVIISVFVLRARIRPFPLKKTLVKLNSEDIRLLSKFRCQY